MNINIGCSGYSYREWKNDFYPPSLKPSQWFEYYATHFSMLELNNTFYNFPKLKMLEGWYNKSPENFTFVVKAPRTITHYKKLVDCKDQIKDFYKVCQDGLKEKLGCFIFQLPPSYHYTDDNLNKIIESVDNNQVNVFELRHASWWNSNVYKTFKENKIIFCNVSFPGLPDDVIVTTPIVYYRFHGIPQLYFSKYTETELKNTCNKIKELKDIHTLYCAFNNTANVGAIENATWMKKYLHNF